MLVEGYLPCREALWMWDEITQEQLVGVQEYWLERGYLIKTYNRKPHYGVLFTAWPELARAVADVKFSRAYPHIYKEHIHGQA